MANERIGISVEAEINRGSFNTAQKEAEVFARDTKKKLDNALLLELQINKAKLQLELETTRGLLRQAKKDGDQALALELQIKTDKLRSELTEAGRQFNNYRNTGDVAQSRLQAKFDETNKTIKQQGSIIGGLKQGFEGLKSQAIKLAGVFAGLFAARSILNFAKQVDGARSEIIKLTGASGELLESLQTSAQRVFRNVPESIDVVGKAIGEINTRFGATGETLDVLTKDFLDFARITGQDVQQAVRGVSRLLQDSGVPIEDTGRLLDILTQASQSTGVNLNTLVNTATNFGVQFRTLGFSLEETIALLSKFESEGVSVEKITSGLTQALNNLAKKGFEDPIAGFKQYSQAIKEATTDTEAITLAQEVFGARAGADLAIAIREGRFEIDELTKSLQNADGSLSKTAKEALTLEQRFSIAGNQLKAEFIPILESIIPIAFSVIDAFGTLSVFARKVFAGLIISIGEVQKIFLGFKVALEALKVGFQLAFNAIASSVSIAVTNVIGRFQYLFDNASVIFGNFKKTVGNLVDNIGIAFSNLGPLIGSALNTALVPINSFLSGFTKAYNKTLGKIFGNIEGGFQFEVDFGETKEFKKLSQGYEDLSDDILKATEELTNSLKQNQKDRNAELKQGFKQFAQNITDEVGIIESAQNQIALDTQKTIDDLEIQRGKADQRRINAEKDALKGGPSVGGGGGASKKAVDETIKQEEELRKRRELITKAKADYELQVENKKNKKIQDNLKGLEEQYKTTNEVFKKEIADSEKATEKFIQKIVSLTAEIAKIDEQLTSLEQGRADTLGKRNVEIEKELEKLRAEEVQNIEQINKLLAEQELIKQNASSDELAEAKRISELSPTALFLEQFEAKKKALQEDKILKQEEIASLELQKQEEEAILTRFTDAQVALEERYTLIKEALEARITNNLQIESKKREDILEKLRLKALETAEAMRSAGIGGTGGGGTNISNSNEVNVGGITVNSQADMMQVEKYLSK